MKIKFIIFSYLPVCDTHSFFFLRLQLFFSRNSVGKKRILSVNFAIDLGIQ